jgi:hypothetical protein
VSKLDTLRPHHGALPLPFKPIDDIPELLVQHVGAHKQEGLKKARPAAPRWPLRQGLHCCRVPRLAPGTEVECCFFPGLGPEGNQSPYLVRGRLEERLRSTYVILAYQRSTPSFHRMDEHTLESAHRIP